MQASEPTRHETYQRVTVREAAELLGVSGATIRRMIRDGRLVGERVLRPQGTAFLVWIPADASAGAGDASSTDQAARVMARDNASPADVMLAAWSRAVVEPLTRLIEDQQRQLSERAETIGRQAERMAALETQLAAAEDRIRALEAPRTPTAGQQTAQAPDPTTEPPEPPWRPEPSTPAPIPPDEDGRQPWWRRWWAWVGGAL
jgi:excisionase family DNA binding protein